MEDSSEDESFYITQSSTNKRKLSEERDVDVHELAVLFENENAQEGSEETDEDRKGTEHVANLKLSKGWFASLVCSFAC